MTGPKQAQLVLIEIRAEIPAATTIFAFYESSKYFKRQILSEKFEILKSILIAFDSNSLHYQILVPRCRSSDKGNLHDTSRNTSCWVCPVDFDGRREMSSLSVKTVVVHTSVTSLIMETDFQKRGLVHRVPCAKSREKLREFFQSVCVLFW